MQLRTFHALRTRDFRYLWLGHLGTGMTLWMDMVVRSWLVWELTGDPFLLGLVNLFRAIPFLIFSFPSGIAADRFNKKYVLMVSQAATMVLHVVLATLITSGAVQVWHVFLTSFLAGAAQSFIQPTRQSLVPVLVKKEDVMNAVALGGGAMNVSRIVGPAVAGTMVGIVGIATVYYVQAAVFILVIIATATMRVPPRDAGNAPAPVFENIREGFSYISKHPVVLAILVLALVPMVFGMPYIALLPVFADEVYGIGASGLGLLTAAPGIGSVAGAIAVASAGSFKRKGLVLLCGAFGFGVLLVVFALSRWLPFSLAVLMLTGIFSTSYMTLSTTLLLTIPPPEFHGRIMSIFMMDRGLVPLGSVLAGALAAQWSAPLAVSVMGAMCALLVLATALYIPSVRRLQ